MAKLLKKDELVGISLRYVIGDKVQFVDETYKALEKELDANARPPYCANVSSYISPNSGNKIYVIEMCAGYCADDFINKVYQFDDLPSLNEAKCVIKELNCIEELD